MITLKEIAKRCDVSASTVSNILNGRPKVSEETKERVLAVIKETGYQPNFFAQGIRKKKSRIIGILNEGLDQFSSPDIIEGIMAYCEEKEYRTILVDMRLYDRWQNRWYNNDKMYNSVLKPSLRELMSIRVDGIIYVAGHAHVIKCFGDDFALPAVVAYAYSESGKQPSIIIDDEKGGYDATSYLILKGHRKIGLLLGNADNIHTQKREKGYQRALFENEVLYNPNWVYQGSWEKQDGYKAAEMFVRSGVTAVFAINDRMAVGIYEYLFDNHLTPGKDLSIIGFDNSEYSSYVIPNLTTMNIPLKEIGRTAAEKLFEELAADEKGFPRESRISNEIQVECNLVERDSVKQLT